MPKELVEDSGGKQYSLLAQCNTLDWGYSDFWGLTRRSGGVVSIDVPRSAATRRGAFQLPGR